LNSAGQLGDGTTTGLTGAFGLGDGVNYRVFLHT
jgi:hypothetical protein